MSVEEWLLCVVLSLSFLSFGYMAFKHLTALIHEVKVHADIGFKQASEGNGVDLSGIEEKLLDLVHNVIGEMNPPSATDHLFGALSQIIQMKVMKSMGMDAGNLLGQSDEEI